MSARPEPDDAAARILDGLNPAQVDAVTHDQGPLLIVAGAGTGKTTVLTRRIAYLIATRRARPEEILALTFTDKAALEMEERVDVLVPYGYADVRISTFHAFGDWLLREHALELGLTPAFRVLNRAEQVLFLRTRLFELPLDHFRPLGDPTRHLQAFTGLFGRAKDEDVAPPRPTWPTRRRSRRRPTPIRTTRSGATSRPGRSSWRAPTRRTRTSWPARGSSTSATRSSWRCASSASARTCSPTTSGGSATSWSTSSRTRTTPSSSS